jgi:hypothetical protein
MLQNFLQIISKINRIILDSTFEAPITDDASEARHLAYI